MMDYLVLCEGHTLTSPLLDVYRIVGQRQGECYMMMITTSGECLTAEY